jgi:murein DD-endopeptidase MepM/ murein hydrolase activator NlpD
MRRLAPLLIVLGVALLAGTAHADTFAVVPSTAESTPHFTTALVPNPAGSVALSFDLATQPSAPAQVSYAQLLGLWQRAGSSYGIPWPVLASINKVESNFGRNMGPSSAGAIGWMQFMPSTWLRWGTDANGDGIADPWNPDDAIFSAARYLAAAGGATDIYRSVYAYNHADWYVKEVLDLANVYGANTGIVLSLDRLQMSLDAARSAVVTASTSLVSAQETLRTLDKDLARREARAAGSPLLSNRLTLESRAGRVAVRRDEVSALVDKRAHALATARQGLARAKQQSAASSFAPGMSQLFGSPSYSSGYVFPVGGGPGVIFASHTHHDYPAVDIAAPMGSPLYALADSLVVRSWSTPNSRCGIGLTLQAFDGQVWTYCHLSVLDTWVVPGASLTAGQEVGLVGDTGHATGPHLHLQLQPTFAWPQQEPWFQSFAGTAFSWSDAGANDGPTMARTLAVEGDAAPVVKSGRTLALAGDVAPVALPAPGGAVFRVAPAVEPQNPVDGVVFFSSTGS